MVLLSAGPQGPRSLTAMRPFSLRRSLCIMLLVVATALSSYADTAEQLLDVIKSQLAAYLPAIRSNSATQVQTLSKLDSALSDISDLVSSISDSLSTNSDYSAIVSELQTLRDTCASYTSAVNSISSALDAIENNQITVDDLTTALASANDALQSLTTYNQLQSLFSSLEEQITAISLRLDSTLDVSGQIDVSSASLGPVVTAVQNVRQKLVDIETWWLVWVKDEWGSFTDRFEDLRGYVYSIMRAVESIDVYLNGEFREKFQDVWTNTTAYLPYLTNGFDSAFLNVLSNNLANIPLYSLDPAWTTTGQNISYYNLARFLGGLLSNQTHKDGYSVGTFIPGASSDGLVRRFFQRGGPSQQSDFERFFGQYSAQMDDQRRYIFSISNTVPYIEGLPRHRQKVGGAGDTWTGAFGDLEWSGGRPQSVSGTPNRTPWNKDYFSTDYFADLLKLLAATNLAQNADIGERLIEAVELFGGSDDDFGPDVQNATTNYVGPTFTDISEVLKPKELFPESVGLQTPESSDLDTFDSETLEKIGYGLNLDLAPSGQILLFPAIEDLGPEFAENYYYDLEQYFTQEDQENVRRVFSVIWHIIFYIFSVHLVYSEIKSAISAS